MEILMKTSNSGTEYLAQTGCHESLKTFTERKWGPKLMEFRGGNLSYTHPKGNIACIFHCQAGQPSFWERKMAQTHTCSQV